MTKQFDFTTVLSFITGRLYCHISELYTISKFLTNSVVNTIELSELRDRYKNKVLAQLSEAQQQLCNNWEHTPDWIEKIAELKNEVVILTN